MSAFFVCSNTSSQLVKKDSFSSIEKEKGPLIEDLTGSHKVKYHAGEEWDFVVESTHKSIDLSMVLPHYRARNQPVNHRMNMFVGSETGLIKAKVCRSSSRTHFFLEIESMRSDVTIWLPSDFRGRIHHSGKAAFSDGFTNRIMAHARIHQLQYGDCVRSSVSEDEVIVRTRGRVMFCMWDVNTAAPESKTKETMKRMFGCTKRVPETAIDWDFLLED